MSYAVEVKDLTKRYPVTSGYRRFLPGRGAARLRATEAGRPPALAGVTLRVEQGESLGLLGQNGAGKTTLIRILTTALLPSAGGGTVAGHDLLADPRGVRARIGVIRAEERSFFWRLSGREESRVLCGDRQRAEARPRCQGRKPARAPWAGC